jgi:subtilisin family serine protease
VVDRRRDVLARIVALAVAWLVGTAAPAQAEAAGPGVDPNLSAVVRTADGEVEVRRGADALESAWDEVLGRSADDVLSLETDQPVQLLGATDPLRPQQWALDKTSYEAAWGATTGGGVTVAVIDTGVRGDHEDLAGALVKGADYVNDGGDGLIDPNGHGTHVAGIIVARASNGRGVAGGAPDARVMPIRVLDANGSGFSSDVVAGIYYAVDKGARVINLSLGGGPSTATEDAINYAVSRGVVVVAAAGNGAQSGNVPVYPGAYANAIGVGSVESNKVRSSFSNYGSYVDLVAPGGGILSTYSSNAGSYAYASGTSMATPYVAAAAALVLGINPKLNVAGVRAALEGAADDLGPAGWDPEYGHGLVDPRDSVTRAVPPPPPATGGKGYWIVDRDGEVHALGGATFYGQPAGLPGLQPVVAGARTPDGKGYWIASEGGAVYAYGNARHYGGVNHLRLNAPIVGMAATPTGKGYFLLARDGGLFTFGDARFYGSTGGMRLNAPVLDLAPTASGRGYWFVAADGGVFSFGDARFYGSTGHLRLAAPVMSLTSKSAGDGYWMIGNDGGVFAFGKALFHGSLPGLKAKYGLGSLPPTKRMRALADGSGYYVMGSDGSVYSFGNARFFGAAPGDAVDMLVLD